MRPNKSRGVLMGATITIACVMVLSSAAFACTYYKGKLEATGFSSSGAALGSAKKTVWGLGGGNQMTYCPPKVNSSGNVSEDSAPNTPVSTYNNRVRVQVAPHDCNGNGTPEFLGDNQHGAAPDEFEDPNGLYDVNYRAVVGNFYGDPNLNDCMTPYNGSNVGATVVVNADALAVNNTGNSGTYDLVLPGKGDFTVCVSGQAPNVLAGQPFQYDAIQTSVRSI